MTYSNNEADIQSEVLTTGRISIIPAILEIICRSTSMGFAAVARVTPEQWIACEVRDEIQFGLRPGGELQVDTTICHEIRQSGNEVIIDHVAEDEFYRAHHTPAMYGFQSYISVPIRRQNGDFFGTLCAIDPRPNILCIPEIKRMFKVYANLISFHIYAANHLDDEMVSSLEKRTNEMLQNEIDLMFPQQDHTVSQSGMRMLIDKSSERLEQFVRGLNTFIEQ